MKEANSFETTAKEASEEEGASGEMIREHLANKRTMLAWARSGIAIIGLGFVVSRFGLLVRELHPAAPSPLPQHVSTFFGATMVAIGGILIILASIEYLRTGRAIDRHAYRWSPALEIALTILLVLAATILTVYLYLTV